MVCIGNFERMLTLDSAKAVTVKSLVENAQQRNCISGNISRREGNGTDNPRPETKHERERKKRKQSPVGPVERDRNANIAPIITDNAPESKKRILNDRSPANVSVPQGHETTGVTVKANMQPRNVPALNNDNVDTINVDSRSPPVPAADSTAFIPGYDEASETAIKAESNQGGAMGQNETVDNMAEPRSPPVEGGDEKLGVPKYHEGDGMTNEGDNVEVPSAGSSDHDASFDNADPLSSPVQMGDTNACINDQESNDGEMVKAERIQVPSAGSNAQNVNFENADTPFLPAPTITQGFMKQELLLAESDDSTVASNTVDRADDFDFEDSRTAIHQPSATTVEDETKSASQALAFDEANSSSELNIFRSPIRENSGESAYESCSEDESNKAVTSDMFRSPSRQTTGRADNAVVAANESAEKDSGMFMTVDI
jgi:hypothetical protein